MRTLVDHIYELVRNSIDAAAKRIRVLVDEQPDEDRFTIVVEDNGRGMRPGMIERVKSPFFTRRGSRKRKVGLGIPMLLATCESTAGALKIESRVGRGTTITATMQHHNIDRPPLGDLADLYLSLVAITDHRIAWVLEHRIGERSYRIRSRELYDRCGSPLYSYRSFHEAAMKYLYEQERSIGGSTEGVPRRSR